MAGKANSVREARTRTAERFVVIADKLDEHPALSLLGSLTDLHNECANGHAFHDLVKRRNDAKRFQDSVLGCLGHAADQRANAKANEGASLPEVMSEYDELSEAAALSPPSNEPAEFTQALRDITRRTSLCCERCRIALRAGGADILDTTISPNEKGQPRSVELHTNLQEMESVCVSLRVGLDNPRFLLNEAERFTELGEWFGEKRDELGAVLETRGLGPAGPSDGQADTDDGEEDTGGTPNGRSNTPGQPPQTVVLWEGAGHSERNIRLARTRTAYLEAGGSVSDALKALEEDGNKIARSTFYNHLESLDKECPNWRESALRPTKLDKSDCMESTHITRTRKKTRGQLR